MSDPTSATAVLLIESDPDCSTWLALLIRMWGYRVCTARCADEALSSARARPPAIVIVEPFLSWGEDGWEVVRQIRAGQAITPRCIAVTTRSRPADYRRSREVGIEAHLLKPTEPAELRGAIAGAYSTPPSRVNLFPEHCGGGLC